MATEVDRWQEIRDIHKEYKFFYQIGGGMTLVLIGVVIGAMLFANDPGYSTNLYTEILSIAVTVFVLNLLAERREQKREERQLKERLVQEAGSTVNDTAVRAVEQLRERGWLVYNTAGLLKGANLKGANLKGANLEDALLIGANLSSANLVGARLNAIMKNVVLVQAYLNGADLTNAYLNGANLRFAYLKGALLWNTYLEGADLWGADLEGANLIRVKFDENTVLPDETRWTPDTDMTRFTDPNHPNFWHPDRSDE